MWEEKPLGLASKAITVIPPEDFQPQDDCISCKWGEKWGHGLLHGVLEVTKWGFQRGQAGP